MIIESEQEIMTEKEKNYFKKIGKKGSEKVLKIIIKDRDLMALQAIIEGQKEEIERLNNIINELEKYFEQEGFWHSLDKIKELKGSDK